jgi:hypothetical protein
VTTANTRYWKCTRPDGLDFWSRKVDYAAALASGETITHPIGDIRSGTAADCLSVSVSPTDCTGAYWPCRLFLVEPVGEVGTPGTYPSKRSVAALRVMEERPAVEALGPQGQAIVALIERARALTGQEVTDLDAAWDAAGAAAWDAAWDAARDAAWAAAWDAAWAAAWDAAWDAAWAAARALIVRDLISDAGFTQEQYDVLTRVWRTVIGPLHPDDADLRVTPAAVTE